MKMKDDLIGKNALITGASSGIGKDIAYIMAEKGINLVLLARREEALIKIKKDLESNFKIRVTVISSDLSQVSEYKKIHDECKRNDFMPDFLVNNAGYGTLDSFHKISYEDHIKFINVLSTSVVSLTQLFIQNMLDNGFGRIINIASLAGFAPASNSGGMYTAVKSMVIKHSEGIHKEYRDKNIFCCAVCPGFTHTEFHDQMGDFKSSIPSFMWMDSKTVAEQAFNETMKGKDLFINGGVNKFLAFLMWLTPKWLTDLYYALIMRKRP
ncbi:MAG: SDR family NAD(P)-dependent oxidoreductase [Pseudomonadota bacterium]|nr:SDR family NAD(P)-dependent oxidoreductase [Pseudomonadota bacterium]MED5484310.1 SDR family NAD(P)-dependent oxidoreductase [Pseudomonadota bacterium]|tara:strand:+ start:1599 stop:2402 length:804 start_codon:yes stop_codon:yes gene_type:complete